MSWQDDMMIEQDKADALNYMGEAEWRDLYGDDDLSDWNISMAQLYSKMPEEDLKKLDKAWVGETVIKGYKGGRIKRPRKK